MPPHVLKLWLLVLDQLNSRQHKIGPSETHYPIITRSHYKNRIWNIIRYFSHKTTTKIGNISHIRLIWRAFMLLNVIGCWRKQTRDHSSWGNSSWLSCYQRLECWVVFWYCFYNIYQKQKACSHPKAILKPLLLRAWAWGQFMFSFSEPDKKRLFPFQSLRFWIAQGIFSRIPLRGTRDFPGEPFSISQKIHWRFLLELRVNSCNPSTTTRTVSFCFIRVH